MLKFSFILDKIKKVVNSCQTLEQLETANKYCSLLLFKYQKQEENYIIKESLNLSEKMTELRKFKDDLIDKKREEMII